MAKKAGRGQKRSNILQGCKKSKSKRKVSTPRPVSNKGGRPTKYKKKYCQELIEFFDIEPYEDIKVPHYQPNGKTIKWNDFKRMPNKLPTLVGFARHIDVCYATLFNWMDNKHASFHQEFLDIVTRIGKALQKEHLIQNGLQGLYNPQAFKFVAVNITDMVDKHDIDLSGEVILKPPNIA